LLWQAAYVPSNVAGLVVATLAELPELVGFFSYSREDDTDSYGRLSALRGRIQAELRGQLGRTPKTFRLWQDKEAIPSGTLWESEIKNAVSQAVFFIPIITPTVIASRYCRFELEAFLEREAALGRDDLIFPIVYIDVPGLEDGIEFENDPVLSLIARRQYVDWREFRYLEVDSTEVRREVGRFCTDIRNALRRRWVSPGESKQQEEAAARQRDEETARQKQQAERARQEAAKRAQEEALRRTTEQQGKQEEVAKQSSVAAPDGVRSQQPHAAAQQDSFTALKQPESKEAATANRKVKLSAAIIGSVAAIVLLAVWLATSSSTPPNPPLAANNSAGSSNDTAVAKNVPANDAAVANNVPANDTPVANNAPANGLTQREIDACVNRNKQFSLDDQINGCTESIRSSRWSGKDLAWAYGDRCIAHKDKAQYDVAMRDCNEAISLDPQDAYAYNTRGAIYHLTNKYDEAIKEYSTAIKLDPKFIDPLHNRGMSYAAKGDIESAIDDYNAALRIDPRDALALYERGIAKQKSGDQNGGNADIAAAKKIDPHIGD